jgi:hypothetical protein
MRLRHKLLGAILGAVGMGGLAVPTPLATVTATSGQHQQNGTKQGAIVDRVVGLSAFNVARRLSRQYRSSLHEPIWTGGLRDSGVRARPASRRGMFRS